MITYLIQKRFLTQNECFRRTEKCEIRYYKLWFNTKNLIARLGSAYPRTPRINLFIYLWQFAFFLNSIKRVILKLINIQKEEKKLLLTNFMIDSTINSLVHGYNQHIRVTKLSNLLKSN